MAVCVRQLKRHTVRQLDRTPSVQQRSPSSRAGSTADTQGIWRWFLALFTYLWTFLSGLFRPTQGALPASTSASPPPTTAAATAAAMPGRDSAPRVRDNMSALRRRDADADENREKRPTWNGNSTQQQ